jgi:hypothetical protein
MDTKEIIPFSKLYDLSLEGKYLESIGKVEDAIIIFEYLINNGWDGSEVYDKLSIYYKKNKKYKDVERVCIKYLNDYENWLKKSQKYSRNMIEKDYKYLLFKKRLDSVLKYLIN